MKEANICECIFHLNMFYYLRPPILNVRFVAKFIYNEYIRPYFLSHVISTIFASDLHVCFCMHMKFLTHVEY